MKPPHNPRAALQNKRDVRPVSAVVEKKAAPKKMTVVREGDTVIRSNDRRVVCAPTSQAGGLAACGGSIPDVNANCAAVCTNPSNAAVWLGGDDGALTARRREDGSIIARLCVNEALAALSPSVVNCGYPSDASSRAGNRVNLRVQVTGRDIDIISVQAVAIISNCVVAGLSTGHLLVVPTAIVAGQQSPTPTSISGLVASGILPDAALRAPLPDNNGRAFGTSTVADGVAPLAWVSALVPLGGGMVQAIAVGDRRAATAYFAGTDHGTVAVVAARSHSVVRLITIGVPPGRFPGGPAGDGRVAVMCMCVHPKYDVVYAGTSDGAVHAIGSTTRIGGDLCDVGGAPLPAQARAPRSRAASHGGAGARDGDVSDDGVAAAAGGSSSGDHTVLGAHEGAVLSMVCTDDHLWTGGQEGAIRVWTPATATALKLVKGHRGAVVALAAVPGAGGGAMRVWSCGADGVVAIWCGNTQRLLDSIAEAPYSDEMATLHDAPPCGSAVVRVRVVESVVVWVPMFRGGARVWHVASAPGPLAEPATAAAAATATGGVGGMGALPPLPGGDTAGRATMEAELERRLRAANERIEMLERSLRVRDVEVAEERRLAAARSDDAAAVRSAGDEAVQLRIRMAAAEAAERAARAERDVAETERRKAELEVARLVAEGAALRETITAHEETYHQLVGMLQTREADAVGRLSDLNGHLQAAERRAEAAESRARKAEETASMLEGEVGAARAAASEQGSILTSQLAATQQRLQAELRDAREALRVAERSAAVAADEAVAERQIREDDAGEVDHLRARTADLEEALRTLERGHEFVLRSRGHLVRHLYTLHTEAEAAEGRAAAILGALHATLTGEGARSPPRRGGSAVRDEADEAAAAAAQHEPRYLGTTMGMDAVDRSVDAAGLVGEVQSTVDELSAALEALHAGLRWVVRNFLSNHEKASLGLSPHQYSRTVAIPRDGKSVARWAVSARGIFLCMSVCGAGVYLFGSSC